MKTKKALTTELILDFLADCRRKDTTGTYHAMLDRAAEMAQSPHFMCAIEGTDVLVPSSKGNGTHYRVNSHCPCPAAERDAKHICKHYSLGKAWRHAMACLEAIETQGQVHGHPLLCGHATGRLTCYDTTCVAPYEPLWCPVCAAGEAETPAEVPETTQYADPSTYAYEMLDGQILTDEELLREFPEMRPTGCTCHCDGVNPVQFIWNPMCAVHRIDTTQDVPITAADVREAAPQVLDVPETSFWCPQCQQYCPEGEVRPLATAPDVLFHSRCGRVVELRFWGPPQSARLGEVCQTCGRSAHEYVYPYGDSRARICVDCMEAITRRIQEENAAYNAAQKLQSTSFEPNPAHQHGCQRCGTLYWCWRPAGHVPEPGLCAVCRQTPPAPATTVQALGEAPASANAYIMLAGHRVQVTCRGLDIDGVLERLERVLVRYQPAEGK